MNVLIKISGDLVESKKALDFIRSKVKSAYKVDGSHVTVIAGAGTQITYALKQEKITSIFRNGRRIHVSEKSQQIAMIILDSVRNDIESQLQVGSYQMPYPDIISPYRLYKNQIWHFNADDYLALLSHNFGESFCLTKKGRIKDFEKYIKVIYFD